MASRAARHRVGRKKRQPLSGVMVFLVVFLSLILVGGVAAFAACASFLTDLPDYEDFSAYENSQKTRIYANDRETLLAEFFIENREPVAWDDISKYVKEGTVATEDERFYSHGAFDPIGIMRAAVVGITGAGKEGASTITQQLVRNTVLLNEMNEISIRRKVREIFLATKLEERYYKDDILLMYLNTINYGSGTYGIQAAAHRYFNKDAKDLNLIESATLVGIPQSPTANDPLVHPEACQARRNDVLGRMLANKVITQEEYDQAIQQNIQDYLNPSEKAPEDGLYKFPYFSSYVRQWLLEKYDRDQVFKGGLKVYTTLDPQTQEEAEAAADRKMDSVNYRYEVALTAVDPETGYIKALVGGRDYYQDQYNLATQARRQPGSSFKTFTLVSSIEAGINPDTLIDCSSPVKLGNWRVENYGGASYGTRTIAGAFAISSNTAFARLVTYLSPERVAQAAYRMGIETTLEEVPSLTLGTQNVTTKEMAQAYATIANGGIAREATPVEEIEDAKGRVIFKSDTTGKRAISADTAYAATKVMEGVIRSGTGTAARLANGQIAAGKTGTSENWRDSYFCGITPQLSVAIWMGARQEEEMPEYVTATSVFSDFMNQVLKGKPLRDFPRAKDPKYTPVHDEKLHIGIGSINNPEEKKKLEVKPHELDNPDTNFGDHAQAGQGASKPEGEESSSGSGSDSSSTSSGSGSTNTGSGSAGASRPAVPTPAPSRPLPAAG